MSKIDIVSVFLEQVRRYTGSDILAEWYEELLASQELPIRLAAASRGEQLLEICANLFFLSQELVNTVVHRGSSSSALVVANSVCMYAAIDTILHDNFAGKQLERLSSLFDDALFWLSAPKETESALLSRATLDFVAKVHIPHGFALVLGGEECGPIENEKPVVALLSRKHVESGNFSDAALEEALSMLGVDISTASSFYDTLSGPERRFLDAALEKSHPARHP